jgi:hypothetical protein
MEKVAPKMNPLAFRTLKIVDICYMTIIYTTLTITFSVTLDKIIGKFDDTEKKKSTIRLIVEIWLNMCVIAVAAYVFRNVIEIIPFPLEKMVAGFEHKRVKEVSGGVIFGFLLFIYQSNLKDKINYVISRITNDFSSTSFHQFMNRLIPVWSVYFD